MRGGLTKEEVESVGYDYGDIDQAMKRYDVTKLKDGWNIDIVTGDKYFYVSNPAVGLWAYRGRFEVEESGAGKGEVANEDVDGGGKRRKTQDE